MALTRRQETECAIITALGDAGAAGLIAADLRREIALRGGDALYLHEAAKSLRDQGVQLVVSRRGHRSVWNMNGPPEAVTEWALGLLDRAISEMKSSYRAITGAGLYENETASMGLRNVQEALELSVRNLAREASRISDDERYSPDSIHSELHARATMSPDVEAALTSGR